MALTESTSWSAFPSSSGQLQWAVTQKMHVIGQLYKPFYHINNCVLSNWLSSR